MDIDFLYFDLADTLIHKPQLMLRLKQFLNHQGASCDIQEVRLQHTSARANLPSPAAPNRAYYDSLNAAVLTSFKIEPTSSRLEELYAELKSCSWEVFDDTVLLSTFSTPLGIASNWRPGVGAVVEEFFPNLFRLVFGSGDHGVAKPSPLFFERILESIATTPEKVLFVGDSPSLDIEPAKEAGMQAVLLDRFGVYEDSPYVRVGGLEELTVLFPGLIQENGASDE